MSDTNQHAAPLMLFVARYAVAYGARRYQAWQTFAASMEEVAGLLDSGWVELAPATASQEERKEEGQEENKAAIVDKKPAASKTKGGEK